MTADPGGRPHIAIVGAGLGGLLCARILQKHHHPVTVFERERPAAVRSPGGALGRQPDTVDALHGAELLDKVTTLARPQGLEVRTLDSDATLLHRLPPTDDGTGTPEIGYANLQRLLLKSLAKGTISWGTSVKQAVPLADGTSRLCLAGGTSQDFELVIGADGAWSRTRQALSDAVPAYLGTTLVETHINHADTRHRNVLRLVGTGSMVARAGTKALIAEHDGHGRLRLRAAFRALENWHTGLDLEDTEAVRARLLTMYDGWDESLLDLLRVSDGDFEPDAPIAAGGAL
ncbi:FAD-dependent monooxygenase [Streptomyces sp. NPDC013178]|uniref:FAD-dependent oxidoreductase n=1 Tax=Streptomyces sp. NPDC013178 TaxID=3155118 RepID=UPI0033EB8103